MHWLMEVLYFADILFGYFCHELKSGGLVCMIIAHNMLAENTRRQVGINNKALANSTEKLSSGYRLNRGPRSAVWAAVQGTAGTVSP